MFSKSRKNRDNFSNQYISDHKYAISQNIRTPVKEKTIAVPSNSLHWSFYKRKKKTKKTEISEGKNKYHNWQIDKYDNWQISHLTMI